MNQIKPDEGYAALFVQSHYSLLGSTIKIKKLVEEAKNFGITSLALTDNHNLFGAMEFSIECTKNKIHGIIGCKVILEGNREILIYCKSRVGYENLSALITESHISSKNDNPYISWRSLLKKTDGLIAIVLPDMTSANLMDLENCANILGDKIEWHLGIEPNANYQNILALFSRKYKKNIIALSQACFMYENEQIAHEAMLCIRDKRYISESDRNRSSPNFKLKTKQEMLQSFSKLEFAIKNGIKLAMKCNFLLETSKPQIPNFRSGKLSQEEALIAEAKLGIESRITVDASNREIYFERLQYELAMINKMGFAGYFLIVSDFIKFAKNNGIPVGPGRGSGSGSIVAWALKITEIDPIKFNLYFERFLNPDRVSIPDFDIDFSSKGREIVINNVRQKYGKNNVAGIITFGSLSSRASLKDVGRVLQIPYSKIDNLSKKVQILYGRVDSLQETYDKDTSFAKEIDEDEDLTQAFRIAKTLEGCYRHVSAHAAGIVIRNQPIFSICPLYKDKNTDLMLTHFSMKYAEAAGLVKFDFLGLTALDVMQSTTEILSQKNIYIDIYKIPLNDIKVFEFLQEGHTKGIFQFETRGMRNLIKDMKAESIEDLTSIVALYRPGPMDNIPRFIRSKEGQEKIRYKYPKIDNILANTYGIMVYQEQIIKIAQEVAGFSMAEGDLLRRAMGKKIPEEMASYRKRFIDGTVAINGGSKDDAEEVFDQIERFANYGFNKAHAVAYAIIGYTQAYLKTYYTIEFISASLTLEQHNMDKVAELINDAKQIGIRILPPSINKPSTKFEIEGAKIIRYSLSAVKNIGIHFAEELIKEIDQKGIFKSFEDLIERIPMNKRQIEYLSMSGALDEFGQNRGQMHIARPKEHLGLFSSEDIANYEYNWSYEEYMKYQKDALGVYIDKHPSEIYPLRKLKLIPIQEIASSGFGCVLLHKVTKKLDRNKKYYGICNLSDVSGFYEAIISDEDVIYTAQQNLEKVVVVNLKNRKSRIIINNILSIKNFLSTVDKFYIKISIIDELVHLKEDLRAISLCTQGVEVFAIFSSSNEVLHICSVDRDDIDSLIQILENREYTWAI